MVARIATPSSINRALNYNEQKVQNGQAVCLHAEGFLKDAAQLNFHDKLRRFKDLIELNERAKTNSLHISLNFDNSDKLDQEKLISIAKEYMSKIGFGEQPYLVYQHNDAGHPHIHIVTTSILNDGSRIDTYNIGRNQSEKARKVIEQSFGLVKAEGRRQKEHYELKPVNAQKIIYGKLATKQAISNVLNAVLNTYKYTSLPELNAVLQQYNIMADRGSENSRIYRNNGLVYRVLDENGKKVGVPIKASDIYGKPGLKKLESKFEQNEKARQPDKLRIKNIIDLALFKSPNHSLQSLIKTLDKEGVHTVLRQNNDGLVYGITYVDHRTKSVFNGSALGKEYSAKAMQERCSQTKALKRDAFPSLIQKEQVIVEKESLSGIAPKKYLTTDILCPLLQPEHQNGYVPHQLKKSRKKKRKNFSNRL